ncbi:MAG: hypothetical protein U0790_24900, partial [Isosphaeraceae bacterium]
MEPPASPWSRAAVRLRPIAARMGRPVPGWTVGLCVLALIALPAWLFADHLRYAGMARDDFVYVSDSRDVGRTLATLFEPHNTHIVPLFRIWTFALSGLAGRLSALPTALVDAAYLHLVLACLAVRSLVCRETRSQAAGLIAMAVLGLSTLNLTAIIWYSASQAMMAGAAVLATL